MKLDSGEELPADLVVYATGYGSMNGLAADIVGKETAGNLHQSRYYSLYLALQLKARQEDIGTPVYGLQEVHHTS